MTKLAKSSSVQSRVTPAEKRLIEQAARQGNETVSEWLRRIALEEIIPPAYTMASPVKRR